MSWQVYINESPRVEDGSIIIRATITDGISIKVQDEYRSSNFDLNAFKNYLNSRVSELSTVEAIDPLLVPGLFDYSVAAPKSDPTRDQFISDLTLLREMKNAIDLGVKTAQDSDYLAQLGKVQKTFDPSFIDLF